MITTLKNKLRTIVPPGFIAGWHLFEGILASIIYQFPSRGMKVIGITGTNGKTTTCHFVTKIFEEAGYHVAMATTIDFVIDGKVQKNNNKQTTLSPFALQKFLRTARKVGCNVAVLEVTSHALDQHRVWGIHFDSVALTNITHDHLDYHKTFENYTNAKKLLFAQTPRIAVLNADDPSLEKFLVLPAKKHILYSQKSTLENQEVGPNTSYELVLARKIIDGTRETMFTAVTPQGQIVINNQLPGRFNISNALAAISLAVANDIPLETIKSGIEAVSEVRGRMEKIQEGQDFTVIIDYAHTPDAFLKIYEAISPIARARIITVHGATGARDKTKRPLLGALSGRWSDIVIITNEDPYHEDPREIMNEVIAGIHKGETKQKPKIEGENLFIIEDRQEAIRKALHLAQKGDIVLVLGKGAEEVMAIGDKQSDHGFKLIPWNERDVVKAELQKIIKK